MIDVDRAMTDINGGHDDVRPPTLANPESDAVTAAPAGAASADPPAVDTGSREHPAIVMRPGPTGLRAALRDGPDVWEVVAALHVLREEDPTLHDEALPSELRAVTGLTTAQVSAALDYYAAHSEEVDERIASNHKAAERAQRSPTAGQPHLDGPT